jgi:signal transduction histidine kinase
MRFFLEHFRLPIILVAVLAVLFLQWRSLMVGSFWREELYREWTWGIARHELFLCKRVMEKLEEPFQAIDEAVNQFVTPDMDHKGFQRWLEETAPGLPLVGAGFIWRRGSDFLTVVPLTKGVSHLTRRTLKAYIDTKFEPGYNIHPSPPKAVQNYLDSLKQDISRELGFSLYHYSYFSEMRTHRGRAEATKVVFGIVWNHGFYRDHLLSAITDGIIADPGAFGIADEDLVADWEDRYNGILLAGSYGDTVFSYGRVDTSSPGHVTHKRYWWEEPGWAMSRMPEWKLYVQNHLDIEAYQKPLSRMEYSQLYPEHQIPIRMLMYDMARPGKLSNALSWLYLSLSLTVIFLVVLSQIIARNRQRDFIAHVSHELRTPLTNVKLFAETLRQDRAVSEEKEDEYLDNILRASDHLSVLVENTLNLARLDAGRMLVNPQAMDLGEWLQTQCRKYCSPLAGIGFTVSADIDPDLPKVKMDPQSLELALKNLIDNAVKYSDDRREIDIAAMRYGRKKAQITVSDRGIGIPGSKRKAVFKRFYRIRPADRESTSGGGVGLSLVKEIVRRHQGRVWCEGREGGGTTFIVELLVAG